MKNLLLGAVASMAVMMSAAPAMAQDGGPVDVIQVWGKLEETLAQELEAYGSRLEIVTEEQIRNGGFIDASQAIEMLVPGLYVAPKNGAFDYVNVSMLGGRTKDVIWLVDGVRISNRLYTTTTPLDTIPAHMIERIEVLKGAQGLHYGTSAVTGAINVITRGFSDETKGAISAGVNSNEGRSVNGYTSGAVGDHRFVVYASHDQAEGFQPYRDEHYQPSTTDRNRGYNVTTFGAKYGYDFSDALKLSATYQHTDAALEFAAPVNVAYAVNDRDEDLITLKLDWSPAGNFDVFVKGYYHTWDTIYTRYHNTVPVSGTLIVNQDANYWGFEDYGINLLGQYQLSDSITILGGADYQNYGGTDEVFLIDDKTEDVIAPFAEVRWDLDVLSGLNLAAGVRHNIPSGESDTTVWNVSGRLGINDYLYTRGMAGTAFVLPDAYQLYVNDPCCEQGNPNLKGEESENIELAIGGEGSRVSWELTAFRREVQDLIRIVGNVPDTRPAGSPGNYACPEDLVNGCIDTFDNEGNPVEFEGAEFVVSALLTGDLTATFNWTHTSAQARGTSVQLANIPEDTAKASLDWAPANSAFGGGIAVKYVGDVEAQLSVPAATRINYGDFFVADLNGRWFLDADRKHRLGFRVENLFDEEYDSSLIRVVPDGGGTPYAAGNLGTERTFHVNYTYNF